MAKVEKLKNEQVDAQTETPKLKSTAKLVKPIAWDTLIKVDKIMFDPNLFEIHKARIDKIFEKESDEVKNRQLQNILLRDTIFNLAMSIVVQSFEFNLDKDEVENLKAPLRTNVPKLEGMTDQFYEDKIADIATKLIEKQLMFEQIAKDENITVTDAETRKVLDDYYAATNMPIGDIIRDAQKLESAKRTLLEEKITVYIIEKFPRNLDELYANMQKDVEAQQKAAAAGNEKKSS